MSLIYDYGKSENPYRIQANSGSGTSNSGTVSKSAGFDFQYDKLAQLVSITNPVLGLVTFAIDALGSRDFTANSGGSTDYAANDLNQYTVAGNQAFQYDLNGNMIQRTANGAGSSYTYDFNNQLVKAVTPAGETRFAYDSAGRRVSESFVTAGSGIHFIWDGNELLAETDANGNLLKSYAHGLGVDEVLSQTNHAQNETLYFHQDALMSTLALTTGSGQVKESYTYDPYGNILSAPANRSTRLLYTGRELNAETGLYYNRARYYDPGLGRFISADPKGYAAGLNLYTYALNNPLLYRDPYGLDVLWGGSGYSSGNYALSNYGATAFAADESRTDSRTTQNTSYILSLVDKQAARAYDQLSKSEKDFLKNPKHIKYIPGMLRDFRYAINRARSEFNNPRSLVQGKGDAFRHALWSALLTRLMGAGKAEDYTNRHEFGDPNNNAIDREMDLYNNRKGREIALANPSVGTGELENIIKRSMETGELLYYEA